MQRIPSQLQRIGAASARLSIFQSLASTTTSVSSGGLLHFTPPTPLAAVAATVASFHTSTTLQRGSKNLDWYRNALRRIEREKVRVDPPVFPVETLHGKPRARAFIDLQFGKDTDATGTNVSRIIVELADDIVPITVDNFLKLCERPVGEGYKGCEFFRIHKGFAGFIGDYALQNGRGGKSAFDYTFFPDENFIGRHSAPGVLGMANSGVHTNSSVFYITSAPRAEHLDGRNVVFGRVIDGLDVILKKVDSAFCIHLKPANSIFIKDAGRLTPDSAEWKAVDVRMAAAAKAASSANSKAKAAAASTPAPAAAGGGEGKKKKEQKEPKKEKATPSAA